MLNVVETTPGLTGMNVPGTVTCLSCGRTFSQRGYGNHKRAETCLHRAIAGSTALKTWREQSRILHYHPQRHAGLSTRIQECLSAGPLTRAQLVTRLGVARTTIFDVIKKLVNQQKIHTYTTASNRGRGRPKTMFALVDQTK